MQEGKQIGKLSFKTEDGFWNAYYVEKDRDPVFLGGLSVTLTDDNHRRAMQFSAIVEDLFADMVRKKFGVLIGFDKPIVVSIEGPKS